MTTRTRDAPRAPVLAAPLLLAMAALVIPAAAWCSSADEAFDEDLGDFHSLGITVRYAPPAGSDPADTVTWEFGDGSPEEVRGPGEAVRHVYAEAGVYYISQTATNSIGSSTAVYKVNMVGYPAVVFVYGHGLSSETVRQAAYNVPVAMPAAPVLDGYAFGGWYADEACTQPYDETQGVTEPMTLYALWTPDGSGGDGHGPCWIVIALIIAGFVLAAASAHTRHPAPAALAALLLVLAALIHLGVIEW